MKAPLTSDGSSATSVLALAALLDVHRDQPRQWRKLGAPVDLNLAAWRAWLISTGRTKLAAGIPDAAPPAPPMKPAPAGDDEDGGDPAPGGATPDWDIRGKRAKALLAERELAESQARLIPRALVVAIARTLGARVAERLTAGLWDQLLPALDATTPAIRAAIRVRHDQAVLAIRADIAALPRECLVQLLPPLTVPGVSP